MPEQRHPTLPIASLLLSINASASTKTKTENAMAKLRAVSIHEFGQRESMSRLGTSSQQHIAHGTAQHSTAQHSTAQHSTAQHSTAADEC